MIQKIVLDRRYEHLLWERPRMIHVHLMVVVSSDGRRERALLLYAGTHQMIDTP